MRILLIEENKQEAGAIKHVLKEQGCLTDIAYTPKAGVDLALENIYHAIILSYDFTAGLSDRILRNIRANGIHTPILAIGENMTISRMQRCFNMGADDFINRPFSAELLSLRLKIMDKRQDHAASYYRLGDVAFIPELHLLRGISGDVVLTSRESEILELLVINRQQILSRTTIEARVWNGGDEFNSNLIEVHISNLRKKLRQMTDILTIDTIRNVGYSFRVEEDKLYTGKVI